MSYIGNQPTTTSFLTDTFSGTGSQTAFTTTLAPASTTSILVAITGVLQDPSTYSVSGTTLTFTAAPPSGTSNISVRYLGLLPIAAPLINKMPFYNAAGAAANISLLSNNYLPFYQYNGTASNIPLIAV